MRRGSRGPSVEDRFALVARTPSVPAMDLETTARLVLAPGLRVVRRGRDRLQVGLYDDRRAVLPRTPETEALLDSLLDRTPVGPDLPAPLHAVLDVLRRRGCVEPALGAAEAGSGATVSLSGELPGADVALLLGSAGLRRAAVGTADVALLLAAGELAREDTDRFVRLGVPHLVVRLVDGGAVLGPFVVPGRTACLRCIDAHRGVEDPEHVTVTERYVRATARSRLDGAPDDIDPVLAVLAASWAVRDLAAHVRGHEPSTWSRTWRLGREPARILAESWRRHPGCGCAWPEDGVPAGRMGP